MHLLMSALAKGTLGAAEISGDQTVTIPVHEEEIQITKRLVLKEEVEIEGMT